MFFRPILPLKCLTHGELYERNLLFKQTRRSKSESISRRQVSVEFAAEDEEIELEVEQNVDISAILTDWKFSQLNSPNADLTYFFLSSTTSFGMMPRSSARIRSTLPSAASIIASIILSFGPSIQCPFLAVL